MLRIVDRWKAGGPEFVVLAGSLLALIGNAISLTIALTTQADSHGDTSLLVLGVGMGFAVLTPLPLRMRKAHPVRRFAFAGASATALTVVSLAGLVGGGLALGGAMWGIMRAYEPRP